MALRDTVTPRHEPQEEDPPPDEGRRLDIDTPQGRRRTGMLYLVVGVPVLVIFAVLSALTGNWRWLLYASPIFMLCLALALILLITPPDEPDKPDE
jgi:hypothetical protein